MTYRDLFYKATRLINKGKITLGEYDEMTKPLDREVEQVSNTWSLDNAREDFMYDVYNTLDFLPTNDEANRIIDSFDRVTSSIKQEPRWIPVSERLPKIFEFVDCTCHSLIDDRKDWVIETCYVPQPSNSPYSDWGNIPMLNKGDCKVVAWVHRDIPEPYKPESREEE